MLKDSEMDDGDSKINKKIKRERNSDVLSEGHLSNVSTFLQSIWVRCRSIFPNITDRKFMESELRFVFYCGIILWVIHLLFQTFK